MKSIEKTPKIKNIQDFYDKFRTGNNQPKDVFKETFDVKRYQYLCDRSKWHNLTHAEKKEYFYMFRELSSNLSVIRNGEIISLESIEKNFDKHEYLELSKLLSEGKIQEKDKIKLYKLMQDAQDLGYFIYNNKVHFCGRHYIGNINCKNAIDYQKFTKISVERYKYLSKLAKEKIDEQHHGRFFCR